MALLFASTVDDPVAWAAALDAHEPGIDMRVWPDAAPVGDIDAALVWRPERGMLAGLPNLRVVFSLGAGVDHIFADSLLPDVPVVRLVDPALTSQMVEYVVLAVLHRHRRMDEYRAFQAQSEWRQLPACDTARQRVGVMGVGAIGMACAQALQALGFAVAGWRRGGDHMTDMECFHGADGLGPFLARSDILVCLLPLTDETTGILDEELFERLPRGAYVINAARGGHQNEKALIAAIDSEHLSGAWLDVCETEPLPRGSRLWGHPAITLTPHIAGQVLARTAAAQVAANLRRVRSGLRPHNVVEAARGY